MKILNQIHSSADVKLLPESDLPALCTELRKEILTTVSKTGGHLASSLGAVELTVALHRVYDSASDRLLLDVGHQSYAHKLLTGRRERFSTLRQLGGLAGFCRPEEAADDPAVTGHASTSVSVALGMARARSLLGADYAVAAVIGDGALTGGVAYEALSDCGESGEPIVIVLNDNNMSISRSVGGVARLLSRARLRPGYLALKRAVYRVVGQSGPLHSGFHRVKEWVKGLLLPDNLFEDMGFTYLGPVDGHNLKSLIHTLAYARELNRPVLVHINTVKGKGFPPAERDPEAYHGVGPFDPEAGVGLPDYDFSACLGEALCDAAAEDERVVALTAAMSAGTGLESFRERFSSRFFDVGIAEQHAAAMAAGMAKQGLKPVYAVYSTFLQRAYDMLIHDIALSGAHVVLAVDRAGLVGRDGVTHQGSFDVSYLCSVPGLTVLSPSNYGELRSMLRAALAAEGPVALRYPRGSEGEFLENTAGKDAILLRSGGDVTLVTYGIQVNDALTAAKLLSGRGVSAAVVKLNRLDRPDFAPAVASLRKTGRLIVLEDAAMAGCLGLRLLAELECRGVLLRGQRLLNLGSGVVEHGSVEELRRKLGQDPESIARAAEELLARGKGARR